LEKYLTYFLAIFLALLIFSMPICFAAEVQNAYKTQSTDTNTSNSGTQTKAVFVLPFVGLGAVAVAALLNAGIYYIAIGGAVLLGTLVISHIATTNWVYYYANYTTLSSSAYKHTNQIKDILGLQNFNSMPGKKDNDKMNNICKDIMNEKFKFASEYSAAIQNGKDLVKVVKLKNGKYMSVIGKEDGKTIYHCSPDDKISIISKIKGTSSGGYVWKVIRGFMQNW
jgi:hypothetical protein